MSSSRWAGSSSCFTGTGEINRRDYGITTDMPLADGGAVVGDKVKVALEIELAQSAD